MLKCEDAISTVNANEKEVRFKATVGKEQPWEYLGTEEKLLCYHASQQNI